MEKHPAVTADLGLRGERFPHGESVDGTRGERARDVGRRHFDDPEVRGFHAELLEDGPAQLPLATVPVTIANGQVYAG